MQNRISTSTSGFGSAISAINSTSSRLFIGVFGILMFPTLTIATIVYIASIIFAPCVDIDGIREPVAGSLLYGNNII
jgi:photosystem II P680 reaction center D1 protein